MKLEGSLRQDGGYWLAEIPLLDLMTQGMTRQDAQEMVADAIQALVGKQPFDVRVTREDGGRLEVGSSDVAVWMALILRRQREKHGLSLSEVARRLGQRSKNAYARYERGEVVPSMAKFLQLLAAVSPEQDLLLTTSRV